MDGAGRGEDLGRGVVKGKDLAEEGMEGWVKGEGKRDKEK
jgi:hypothetical protein